MDGCLPTILPPWLPDSPRSTSIVETAAAPANPNAVMQQVVKALFQDFPGESGKTVVVADPPNAN